MKVVNRIKDSQEFQDVINTGNKIKFNSIWLFYKKNQLGRARVGISIPTKIGHAVKRNKIRRQIRAILHETLDLSLPYDLIFIPKLSYQTENFNEVKQTIINLLEKVGQN